MKTILAFALCLISITGNAANPSTKSFRATGGLTVTSNDATGLIVYDGSGIAGSGSTQMVTAAIGTLTVTNSISVLGSGTNQFGSTAFTNLSAGVLALDANLTAYSKTDVLTNLQSTPVSFQGGFTNSTTIVVTQAIEGASVIVGRWVGAPAAYENGISNAYSGTPATHYMDLWTRQNSALYVPLRLRGDGISEISSNLVVGMRLGGSSLYPRGTLELRAPVNPTLMFGLTGATTFTNQLVSLSDGASASNNVLQISVTDQTGGVVASSLKQRGDGITELSGRLQINGTTNQIWFGATNVPPTISAANIVKWVSVRIAGETNAYRMPLYE